MKKNTKRIAYSVGNTTSVHKQLYEKGEGVELVEKPQKKKKKKK